ncbi:MAG: ribosomal protein S18-alanine N-acetyltransferase [Sandaracinaceae bacterium]|nr:ribosomal protein S18-alanine N-acetyltransferase [Sandaracinaceae bacterium]
MPDPAADAGRTFVVRRLEAGDEPTVAALSMAAFERGWNAEELGREKDRKVARVLVADEAGVLLGYAIAWVIAGEAEVLSIAVDPPARRRGVARALLDGVLEGAERAVLEVRARNLGARALYEDYGFALVGARRGYYSDGEDALLMAWLRPSSP